MIPTLLCLSLKVRPFTPGVFFSGGSVHLCLYTHDGMIAPDMFLSHFKCVSLSLLYFCLHAMHVSLLVLPQARLRK